MSDQAVIGLVMTCMGGLGTLIYYLISSLKAEIAANSKAVERTIKENNDNMLKKIERFIEDLAETNELLAVKSTMLDYMGREIETIKANCWRCNPK